MCSIGSSQNNSIGAAGGGASIGGSMPSSTLGGAAGGTAIGAGGAALISRVAGRTGGTVLTGTAPAPSGGGDREFIPRGPGGKRVPL
jgi:hypothetical protein